jgi:hypothetical protein
MEIVNGRRIDSSVAMYNDVWSSIASSLFLVPHSF